MTEITAPTAPTAPADARALAPATAVAAAATPEGGGFQSTLAGVLAAPVSAPAAAPQVIRTAPIASSVRSSPLPGFGPLHGPKPQGEGESRAKSCPAQGSDQKTAQGQALREGVGGGVERGNSQAKVSQNAGPNALAAAPLDDLPPGPVADGGVPGKDNASAAKPGGDVARSKEKTQPAPTEQAAGPPQTDPGSFPPAPNGVTPAVPVVAPVAPSSSDDGGPPADDPGRDPGPGGIESVKGDARRPARPLSEAAAIGSKGTEPSIAPGPTDAPQSPTPQSQPAVHIPAALGLAASNAGPEVRPSSHTEPAASPAASAAAPSLHASDGSPAGQVAPVMVSLVGGAAGTHRLVLRLDPPELGRVEIRLVREPDTGARVEVTAERPATLALLRLDEPALHRALNDAGVPQDGRTLTMQLGQPGGQELARQGGGQGGESARRFVPPSFGSESANVLDMQPVPAPRYLRTALDITA